MTAPVWAHRIVGTCHCGNICYVLHTDVPADQRIPRVCHCEFCSRHRPRYWSDPSGQLDIIVEDDDRLLRYRFGHRTAEFVLCGSCGVFCFAIAETGDRQVAVANLNLAPPAQALPDERSIEVRDEDEGERSARRGESWTPLERPWAGG